MNIAHVTIVKNEKSDKMYLKSADVGQMKDDVGIKIRYGNIIGIFIH